MLPGQLTRLGRMSVAPGRGLVAVVMMVVIMRMAVMMMCVIVRMIVRIVFMRSGAQQL